MESGIAFQWIEPINPFSKVEETKRAVTATAIPDAVISPNEAGRRHSKAASTKWL